MFLNRSRNYAFGEPWRAGPRPRFFQQQVTNTTVEELLRTHPIEHPQRQVITPQHFGGDDFIYEGPRGYRAIVAAAGAVDDWRLWAGDENEDYDFSVTPVGPWDIVLGVNDTFQVTEGAATGNAVIAAGSYSADTLLTALDTAIEAATGSANTYTWSWNSLTRLFSVLRATGADPISIQWTDPVSTAAALLGFTADDTGATTYTADIETPRSSHTFYRMDEFVKHSLSVVVRNSVAGNLLRLRVVGLNPDFSVANYLNAQGRWQAADAFRTFRLSPAWNSVGVTFEGAPSMKWWIYQISNVSAGAQTFDVGRLWIPDPVYYQGGEEVT